MFKINDFLKIGYFDRKTESWIIKDFYPLIVDNPQQGLEGYTTRNSDFSKIDLTIGLDEGSVKFQVPYTLEGQKGTVIGDFFNDRNLQVDYTVAIVDNEIFSIVDKSFKYSTEEKGIVTLEGIQFCEWFKNVLVPPNVWRPFNRESGDSIQKGYKGKVYYNNKTITNVLKECFERSFDSKRLINKPGGKLNELDINTSPKGFRPTYVSDYYTKKIEFELEPQGIQKIIGHINDKYDQNIRITSNISSGLMGISIYEPKKYDNISLTTFRNIEVTSKKNKDFLNKNITLNADSKYVTSYQPNKKFVSIAQESFKQLESYSTDENTGPSEETSNTKKYGQISYETLILEGISDIESYFKVRVGDIVNGRTVIGKNMTVSKDTLTLDLAFDESASLGDIDIISDLPDVDKDTNSNAVFLYYGLSSLEGGITVGKKLSPKTALGKESDNYFVQAQNGAITLEDFRRKANNLDSVGGTHDPVNNFKLLGTIDAPINLTYRVNDDVDFTDSYPNIGIRCSSSIPRTPSKANSEVLQKGTDPDFGNYVLIKFKF